MNSEMKEKLIRIKNRLRTIALGVTVAGSSLAPQEMDAASPEPVQNTTETSAPDNEPKNAPTVRLEDLVRADRQKQTQRTTVRHTTQRNTTKQRTVSRPATRRFSADPRVQEYCEQHNVVAIGPANAKLRASLDRNRFYDVYQTYVNKVSYRYGQAITETVPGEILCPSHDMDDELYHLSTRLAKEYSNNCTGPFTNKIPSGGHSGGISVLFGILSGGR